MEDKMCKYGYKLQIVAYNHPKFRNWYIKYLMDMKKLKIMPIVKCNDGQLESVPKRS